MPSVLEDSISELNKVKQTWRDITNDLSNNENRQISPAEANRIRHLFQEQQRSMKMIFCWPDQHQTYMWEFNSFIREIEPHLEIALIDGQRRYNDSMHRRNVDMISAWGEFCKNLGVNIGILAVGILGTIFGIKFL